MTAEGCVLQTRFDRAQTGLETELRGGGGSGGRERLMNNVICKDTEMWSISTVVLEMV